MVHSLAPASGGLAYVSFCSQSYSVKSSPDKLTYTRVAIRASAILTS